MKNKIVVFFLVTALIISFYSLDVYALDRGYESTWNYLIVTYDYPQQEGYNIFGCYASPYPIVLENNVFKGLDTNTWLTYSIYYTGNLVYPDDYSIGQFWGTITSNQHILSNSGMSPPNYSENYTYVLMQGTFRGTYDNIYPSYDDYLDSLIPPDLPWYQDLWNDFTDFVNGLENSLGEIFGITPLMDFFDDLWTVKVGEGEDQLPKFTLATPTPIPTTPTPIPYQTILTPDGNGGYTINYYYNNPSGTPIITSSPPQNPTGSATYVDNDFEYPYYNNPDNIDNPYEFKIPWYLKLILKGNNVDVDQLDDEYQIAEQTIQSDEVLNAVDNIYDGFQVIPSGWLLMLGAIAALPLFAALIHRMLNG